MALAAAGTRALNTDLKNADENAINDFHDDQL